jgi:hypothetical protein
VKGIACHVTAQIKHCWDDEFFFDSTPFAGYNLVLAIKETNNRCWCSGVQSEVAPGTIGSVHQAFMTGTAGAD